MSLFDKYGQPSHRGAAAAPAPAAAAPGGAGPPAMNPMLLAPHGSLAAAAVISAAFFVISAPVAFSLKKTHFKTYILMLASTLLRGVAFALHAAAQAPGVVGRGAADREAGFHALRAAGFGMAIGVSSLIYFSWFKNCASWARPFGPRGAFVAQMLARAMIPVVIISGPVLGAVSAGLVYGAPPTPASAAAAASVREASMWGMLAALIVVCCLGSFAVSCVFAGARRAAATAEAPKGAPSGAPASVWKDIHAMVLLPLAASLVLVVAAAQRVGLLHNPRFLLDSSYLYGMSALPEVLNAALLAAPLLLGRIAMCYNWEAFLDGTLEAGGGGGSGAAGEENGVQASGGKGAPNGSDVVITADGERSV